jgi:hypothetical protein
MLVTISVFGELVFSLPLMHAYVALVGVSLHMKPSQAGYTALILAAMFGASGCVRLLVESGADLEIKESVRSCPVLKCSLC